MLTKTEEETLAALWAKHKEKYPPRYTDKPLVEYPDPETKLIIPEEFDDIK